MAAPALGSRPGGGDWKVGVRDPRGETSDQLGVFTLAEGFVSTSGDYERTLTADGKTYHHILDPKTGYPADAADQCDSDRPLRPSKRCTLHRVFHSRL